MSTTLIGPVKHVYEALSRSKNLAADAALVNALPQLSPAFRPHALRTLFERGRIGGLTLLVSRFRDYDDDLRHLITESADVLFEATRSCIASDSINHRLSAIELIEDGSLCRLAYLLTNALTLRCPQTTTASAHALLSITRSVLDRWSATTTTAERRIVRQDMVQLADALAFALGSWQAHFRSEVALASMWLCALTEETLFKKASAARSNFGRAAIASFRANPGPMMAAHAIRALRNSELRPEATRLISECDSPSFVKELLDNAWVTLDPENAKACSWIRTLTWMSDDFTRRHATADEHANNAVRLVSLSGINQEEKLGIYRRMIFGESPILQEEALWQVSRMDSAAATQLLRRVAGWRVESLSRIATHELFRRDPTLLQRSQETTSSAHSPAGRTRDPFQEYWNRFDVLDTEQRVSDGRRLRTRFPSFGQRIRAKLAAADVDERVLALAVIRTLGVVADYQERIYALSHDTSERVRSAAVALLSQLEGATARRILRQALRDPDARVQANAVEVLAAIDAVHERASLEPMLDAPDHRVRANAVKALIGLHMREAALALIAMLEHHSPAHRISGLWVIERLNLTTLTERVRLLAEHDPDECVRERARSVLNDALSLAAIESTSNGEPR